MLRRWWIVGVALLVVPSVAPATTYLLATVTSLNQIRRFDTSGAPGGSFAVSGTVRQMVLGSDGLLYVANQDGSVDRYNPTNGAASGTFTFGGSLNQPIGLVFAPDGELLVGSQQPNRIAQFHASTGNYIGDLGPERPSSTTTRPARPAASLGSPWCRGERGRRRSPSRRGERGSRLRCR